MRQIKESVRCCDRILFVIFNYSIIFAGCRVGFLTEFEPGTRHEGVQELVPKNDFVVKLGELQQVHARACRRKTILGAGVLDAERRIQLFEAKQRRPRAAGHELQQLPFAPVVESSHNFPKVLDDSVCRRVAARVVRMLPKILHVHRCVRAWYQHLQLSGTERLQPFQIDNVGQALNK